MFQCCVQTAWPSEDSTLVKSRAFPLLVVWHLQTPFWRASYGFGHDLSMDYTHLSVSVNSSCLGSSGDPVVISSFSSSVEFWLGTDSGVGCSASSCGSSATSASTAAVAAASSDSAWNDILPKLSMSAHWAWTRAFPVSVSFRPSKYSTMWWPCRRYWVATHSYYIYRWRSS